jgi:hypothetical protein
VNPRRRRHQKRRRRALRDRELYLDALAALCDIEEDFTDDIFEDEDDDVGTLWCVTFRRLEDVR